MPRGPSQPDHDPVIQEFINWVRSDSSQGILGPAPEVNCPFMPDPKLETYFRNHRGVRDILRALFPDGDLPVGPGWIERKCAKVFSILLLIGKGNFIAHFIKHESLSDNYLPFKSRPIDFPTATDDPLFFESFYKQQWTFCARVFQYNEIDMRLDNDRILPIIHKEKIAGGGSAVAYKIILHAAYNRLDPRGENARDPSNRFANTFVLKTYHTSDAARYYKSEVGAFRRLMSNRARESNMIGFYGSYVLDGTYNILLEYANKGTLEQYFQSTDPPSTGEDIIAFWRGIFNVIGALVKMHKPPTEDVEGPQIFHGWHQDVKPANVLVTSEDDETPYNCQFKLADLGLSHFRRKVAAQGGVTDRDARGTRAYGAPECYRSDDFIETSQLEVKQSVDIWSLGCVYSEAAAWAVLGKRGLRQYRLRRQAETDAISKFRDGDCFHNGEEALKTVHETHEYICRNLRASDHITISTLAMVKDMLDDSDLRPNAIQLWKRSRRTLDDAQKKLESQAADLLHGGEHQTRLSQKGSHRRPQTPPQDTSRHQDKRGWSININNEPRERPTMHSSAALERVPSLEITMEDDDASLHTTPDPSSPPPFLASSPFTYYSTLPTQKRSSAHDDFRDSQHSETSNDEHLFDHHRVGMSNGEYRVDRRYQPNRADTSLRGVPSGHYPQRSSTEVGESHIPHDPEFRSHPVMRGRTDTTADSQSNGGHVHRASETSISDPPISPPIIPVESPKSATVQVGLPTDQPSPPFLSVATLRKWKEEMKSIRHSTLLTNKELLNDVSARDHVFIVDDASSMQEHWTEVENLFGDLAYLIRELDPDGAELYFMVSVDTKRSRHTTQLIQMLHSKTRNLRGTSNAAIRLASILQGYQKKLDKEKEPPARFSIRRTTDVRPMNVYIFTNGVWQPNCDVATPIRRLVGKLEALGSPNDKVGIQFIQFGNSEAGRIKLEHLDSGLGLPRDIVDTEPSNGNVWKMLLGSTNKWFDQDPIV